MNRGYKSFAIALAKKAGHIIKANFTLGMKKEWKEDNTPLTRTDLKINKLVLNTIKKQFPDHDILAEEGSGVSGKSQFIWICDPVDGTIPFSHGIPTAVFSLALTKKGRAILSIIYDPFLNRLFFAEENQGAFLNGKRICVSSRNTLKNSLVGMTGSKESPYNLSKVYGVLKDRHVRVINVGSIQYMGALVASGEFVGAINPNSKVEDAAALKILVEEAGGKVTDIFGREQRYDRKVKGQLVTNGVLHNEFVKLIKETF